MLCIRVSSIVALVACACLAGIPLAAGDDDLGIRVPDGFEVSLYADDALAHDIFSMTIDAKGRVVVAGLNYVKILHDEDHDGRAEKATLYSEVPASGAHGMYFDGPDLICTGDNSVMRLIDRDADGDADDTEVWTKLRHPEHGANGIVKGPDGWYYIACGNDAGVSEEHAASPTSPVKQPRSGAIVRISPDGKTSEVFAHGFRNPYDLDFNTAGHLFTVDSDGERDHYLPWYTPTRLFEVAQGREHGWLLTGWTRSWSRPEWFYDNVERTAELGRGSPTGVKVYMHRQFPKRYRRGVFSACWTLGRVYFVPLRLTGSMLRGEPEIFIETTGDTGFAPVDIAVGPEGDMFVAIGGRRTRGSVFRVRYTGAPDAEQPGPSELEQVLDANQPYSSWSRAVWVPKARALGQQAFEQAASSDGSLDFHVRARAIEILVELFGGLRPEIAKKCLESGLDVTSRAAWAIARNPNMAGAVELLAPHTQGYDLRVERQIWEALEILPAEQSEKLTEQQLKRFAWSKGLQSLDRRVRFAAIQVAKKYLEPDQFSSYIDSSSHVPYALAEQWIVRLDLYQTLEIFRRSEWPHSQLEAVRLMQIALGDLRTREGLAEVYSGYQAERADQLDAPMRRRAAHLLAEAFPSGDRPLDWEIARTLGVLGAPANKLLEKLTGMWTDKSDVRDDIHYLIVMSLLPGERTQEVTRATASALASLHVKMREGQMTPSRNWPLRVGEAFDELVRRDPSLPTELAKVEPFGLPEHSLFVSRVRGDDARLLAEVLLDKVTANDEDWTPELVDALKVLPRDKLHPHLKDRWDDYSLRDSIALVLAEEPAEEDRELLVASLGSVQPNVVERASAALQRLASPGREIEITAAIKALRLQLLAPKAKTTRESIANLLRHWTGQELDTPEARPDQLQAAYQPWFAWFEQTHPDAAKTVLGRSPADWSRRLAAVKWDEGDSMRGNNVFEKLSCHRCHRGQSRLGPDLTGAAGRFSREDLFAAIVDPNKEVAPLYQTMQVLTRDGEVHDGLVVYESPESTLLQTGPDTTIRITGVQSQRLSAISIMPTGLLNDATDQELADLYAYMKTLTK